ncbi:uncharacterized protein Z520_00272 [Fonsecaea multimorphosa CBS 102226]|uniref:Vacuolar sorting protein Vps3844 C-terminal domain-containing protein n=1 Tax=Fonsecaea multimorphosa CBS 102226 TaxID=1442371 RepID=A0A0D2HP23_9EURO|nr:uncharacterized protein Z520_00272 [Fonsecaea multimorphosa CBS 102226]KIY03581.1 hypothetical protein Z520_00272 [Fonsecaea multimorphosa CBS 102226]OAL32283.1 hypothetical protein AYO22_00305 [Fonsecaea multimorphosa]
MKPLSVLLPCAALAQYVAAQGAYLFTIDRSITTPSTGMIDSEMASAIIARRRALTADRYLGITDSMLLEDLNTYGGYQAPLFGESHPKDAPGKLFIRISGVDMQVNDFNMAMPDLWISDPTKDLLSDFKAVTDGSRKEKDGLCEYEVPASRNAPNSKGVEVVFTYPAENGRCLAASEIPNIPIILSLHSFLPTNPSSVKTQLNSLVRILKHFSATDNVESTLLLLPSTNKLKNPKKKNKAHNHKHAARSAQESEEERLDLPSPSSVSDFETITPAANTSTNFTLPSVIPQCFTSQSACENTTNSCSGHGSCYKAHSNCFKCRCTSTLVRINEDGTKKTVQWGGNACQKKDISVPFVMFASFGVVMTALVAGAIGMLYSMGAQELPSVIGAGVAGPRAQK